MPMPSRSSARLPCLARIPSDDSAYVTTCRPSTSSPMADKPTKAVRFALASETTAAELEMQSDHMPKNGVRASATSRKSTASKCRVMYKRVACVSKPMGDSIAQASKLATSSLVKQANDLTLPLRRRRHTTCRSLEKANGIEVYEHQAAAVFSDDDDDEDEHLEMSVDDDIALLDLTRRQTKSAATASSATPGGSGASRLLGATQLHASLDEFVDAFSSQNDHNLQLLNPGMASVERLHTLLDEKHKKITLKSMTLAPRSVRPTGARRRDFVVVECQKRFQLPDGRFGWVQSHQSVDLPWAPSLETDTGVVRAWMHQSGVVAIESADASGVLNVVVASEIALNGRASRSCQRAVSRRRVVKILQALGEAIATTRVERLSYLTTQRFIEVEAFMKDSQCKLCSHRIGRLDAIPGIKTRHACRKCGATVCRSCSQVWKVERHRSSTIVGGGRVTTLTRVCTECLLTARQPPPSPPSSPCSSRSSSPLLAETLNGPRPSEPVARISSSRPRDETVFAQTKDLNSIVPMRSTQLEFQLLVESLKGSVVGDSDEATTDEDDDSRPNSPLLTAVHLSHRQLAQPKPLRLSELNV